MDIQRRAAYTRAELSQEEHTPRVLSRAGTEPLGV